MHQYRLEITIQISLLSCKHAYQASHTTAIIHVRTGFARLAGEAVTSPAGCELCLSSSHTQSAPLNILDTPIFSTLHSYSLQTTIHHVRLCPIFLCKSFPLNHICLFSKHSSFWVYISAFHPSFYCNFKNGQGKGCYRRLRQLVSLFTWEMRGGLLKVGLMADGMNAKGFCYRSTCWYEH